MLGVLCVSAPAILCLHFICGLHTSLFKKNKNKNNNVCVGGWGPGGSSEIDF